MDNPMHEIMVRRRAELGISQAQAAARAGISRSTWNTWESPDEQPLDERWHTIAKALEMPIDELEKAGATSWFLKSGPSAFQLSLLQTLGITLEGAAIPVHAYADPNLFQLDRNLEVDLGRSGYPPLSQKLGQLRNQIRNLLVAQDTTHQLLLQLVKTFRSLNDVLTLPDAPEPREKKAVKVSKKSPMTRRRRPKS